jgi:hypothetical protein
MKASRRATLVSCSVVFVFAASLAACSSNRTASKAASTSGSEGAFNAAATALPSVIPTPPVADGDPVGPRRYSNMKSTGVLKIPVSQAQGIPQSCMLDSDQCTWTIYLQTDYAYLPSPTPVACPSLYCFQIAAKVNRDEENKAGIIPGTTQQFNLAMTVSAQLGKPTHVPDNSAAPNTGKRRGDPIRHRRYTNMSVSPTDGTSQSAQGIPTVCMRDSSQCTWTIHIETSKRKKKSLGDCQDQCFSINASMNRTELPYAGYNPAPDARFWLRMTISAQIGPPASSSASP